MDAVVYRNLLDFFTQFSRISVRMAQQNAISPTRAEDFPEWYQQVIKAADLAENSEVRGCMVIKPWAIQS